MIKIHVDWAGKGDKLGGVVEANESFLEDRGADQALKVWDRTAGDVRAKLAARAWEEAVAEKHTVNLEAPVTTPKPTSFEPEEFVAGIRELVMQEQYGRSMAEWKDLPLTIQQKWRKRVVGALEKMQGSLEVDMSDLDQEAYSLYLKSGSSKAWDELGAITRRFWRNRVVDRAFEAEEKARREAEELAVELKLEEDHKAAREAAVESLAKELFSERNHRSIHWDRSSKETKEAWRKVARKANERVRDMVCNNINI